MLAALYDPACSDAESAALCSQPERWRWKYDAATKQGKWFLDEAKGPGDPTPVSSAQRPRVTMAELEEDRRKAAEKRAAMLRRETANRLKRKQMLALKKEQEEEERRQQVLDQRRAEIEEKRQLINAGARVRTEDVFFDDIEPSAPHPVGEGVIRRQRPAQEEKPGWDAGVGPGSGPPRIGYQPPSLIPPPVLPPDRNQRQRMLSVAGSRQPTGSTTASSSRRRSDVNARHGSAAAPATGAQSIKKQRQQHEQQQQQDQQLNLDDVLARADQGIQQARLFSAAAAADACSRPETSASSASSAADRNGVPQSDVHFKSDMQSGRNSPCSAAPSSIHFWNNMAPCSEGGGGPSVGGTPRSTAGFAGGGAYRRKVDAVKEQIETLKRVSTAGSVASNASRTSTATASSSRTAYTHSSKTSARGYLSSRPQLSGTNGTRPAGCADRDDQGDTRGARAFSLAKPPRGGAASSRYGVTPEARRQGSGNVPEIAQAGAFGQTNKMDSDQQFALSPRQEGQAEGPSRVRGGLAAARAHAALLDSLDLDSPAHRNNAKAEAYHRYRHLGEDDGGVGQLRQSRSLVESLDLDHDDGGGNLKGLIRADQWLKRAVDTALGANADQLRQGSLGDNEGGRQHLHPSYSTSSAAHVAGQAQAGSRGGRKLGKPGDRDMQHGGIQFGPATVSTRQISRPAPLPKGRPPSSSRSVLRKSAELLKKQSQDTRKLLQQYRTESSGIGAGTSQTSAREDRLLPLRSATNRAHTHEAWQQGEAPSGLQQQGMHAIEEQIHEVDDEEAQLMASLARLDCKLAEAADPAAAYLQAAEYKDKQQKRHEQELLQAQQDRDARRPPLAVRKLPPAPALDHWNRTEDLQQFSMQNARDRAVGGGGGSDTWDSSSKWGTAQSHRRPGAIQRVERVPPAMGAHAKDRRTRLKNK